MRFWVSSGDCRIYRSATWAKRQGMLKLQHRAQANAPIHRVADLNSKLLVAWLRLLMGQATLLCTAAGQHWTCKVSLLLF